MKVIEFLNKSKVNYETKEHKPAFTAQRMAAAEHEPGKYVAKPVIVKVDGEYVMCVLAASRKINMQSLKDKLKAKQLEIASEDEIAKLFDDCELGAEPPFGNLYNLKVIMDKTLESDDHILFQAGSHEKAIKMSMSDYIKLVNPEIMDFTYNME